MQRISFKFGLKTLDAVPLVDLDELGSEGPKQRMDLFDHENACLYLLHIVSKCACQIM